MRHNGSGAQQRRSIADSLPPPGWLNLDLIGLMIAIALFLQNLSFFLFKFILGNGSVVQQFLKVCELDIVLIFKIYCVGFGQTDKQ